MDSPSEMIGDTSVPTLHRISSVKRTKRSTDCSCGAVDGLFREISTSSDFFRLCEDNLQAFNNRSKAEATPRILCHPVFITLLHIGIMDVAEVAELSNVIEMATAPRLGLPTVPVPYRKIVAIKAVSTAVYY
ncbi:hypothetical protein M378DRAFT_168485 [Amanita muscaria Koide BX008]|uniref:Uncharacterized protein n=1 Tax=Amanita muscaria (strain Koide BX008) TaxID=946122 RepID=A0A0C2T0Z3_AMAMK|nr:hypothetical protein M378DRAFT_168485 [Amanita muscaria Koide BX008]